VRCIESYARGALAHLPRELRATFDAELRLAASLVLDGHGDLNSIPSLTGDDSVFLE
jgi:hypothetical protein